MHINKKKFQKTLVLQPVQIQILRVRMILGVFKAILV